jgi:hypothetical protein
VSPAIIGGDQAEEQRRLGLARYVCRLLTTSTLVNGLRSALEEIEKRSRALLEKHVAARFVDKGEDSKEVARLIERLRETITHYQVRENRFVAFSTTHIGGQISQQQAIYDQIISLTVSVFRFVSILCTDDWSFRLDFFRYPLKTS